MVLDQRLLGNFLHQVSEDASRKASGDETLEI